MRVECIAHFCDDKHKDKHDITRIERYWHKHVRTACIAHTQLVDLVCVCVKWLKSNTHTHTH